MKLHEAIEKLILETGRSMTTTEIANELNKNGWYKKKDGSVITAYQIHGRTKNYPQIFTRNGSKVSLKKQADLRASTRCKQVEKVKKSHTDSE